MHENKKMAMSSGFMELHAKSAHFYAPFGRGEGGGGDLFSE